MLQSDLFFFKEVSKPVSFAAGCSRSPAENGELWCKSWFLSSWWELLWTLLGSCWDGGAGSTWLSCCLGSMEEDNWAEAWNSRSGCDASFVFERFRLLPWQGGCDPHPAIVQCLCLRRGAVANALIIWLLCPEKQIPSVCWAVLCGAAPWHQGEIRWLAPRVYVKRWQVAAIANAWPDNQSCLFLLWKMLLIFTPRFSTYLIITDRSVKFQLNTKSAKMQNGRGGFL